MTELQFLIDVLTKEELSPALQKRFYKRLGEVEKSLRGQQAQQPRIAMVPQGVAPILASNQSPSTLAAMARHAQEPVPAATIPAPTSPVAAQALAARQQAIEESLSGRPVPGQRSPRKF